MSVNFTPIAVAQADDSWPDEFRRRADALRDALGPVAQRVDHVGSTAVPGLDAKPTIDVQVSVPSLEDLESFPGPIERLGYIFHDRSLADVEHRFFSAPGRAAPIHVCPVPRLWSETIETHRRDVRQAILDTTATLVAEHGLRGVTMSQIAEETGIGRATLYRNFSDVEAILLAWHERQINGHLEYLAKVRDQTGDAGERLEAVLETFALIAHDSRGHHDTELAAFLHRDQQVAQAQQQLRHMIRDLLTEAAKTGNLRDDIAPDELASYCLHALTAASTLPSKAAVRRLVTVTLAGLHPRA